MYRVFVRKDVRGIALATSLMLALLILILGSTLLTSSQRDLFFQRQQQARDQAELLARSGLEYASFLIYDNPSGFNAALPANTPQEHQVSGSTEVFLLERRQDTITGQQALMVTGQVRKTNGDVLASRVFVVPYGLDNVLQAPEIMAQVYAK